MDYSAARITASIYLAICASLSKEGVRLANDVLLEFADDPNNPKEDADFYRLLANIAGEPLNEGAG